MYRVSVTIDLNDGRSVSLLADVHSEYPLKSIEMIYGELCSAHSIETTMIKAMRSWTTYSK